jgi:hypothetical protein
VVVMIILLCARRAGAEDLRKPLLGRWGAGVIV